MLEKQIQKKIMAYLKTVPGSQWNKITLGPYSGKGISDIIGCYRGHYVALEVKNEGGKATKLQEHFINAINDTGGYAAVVRSVNDVRSFLGHID